MHGNAWLDRLMGEIDFGQCTLQQQKSIKNHAKKMIKNGHGKEEILNKCRTASSIFHKENSDKLEELMQKIDFGQCTSQQQAYIKDYAWQMILGGDKPEFALEVATNMVLLYQNKEVIKTLASLGSADNINLQAIAKFEKDKLPSIINSNGGNYTIIENYIIAQVDDSNSPGTMPMQYFLLTQRRDAETDAAMQANYRLGRTSSKSITKADMELFYKNICPSKTDKEKYAKTVAMHKAFTAISLNAINFPGKNATAGSCEVYRTMEHESLCEINQNYENAKVGDETIVLHNIMESTSIGRPVLEGSGRDTHTYQVPFARVLFAFWTSREHEFVCNLSGIPGKIKAINGK
jgi:hypothetical protein